MRVAILGLPSSGKTSVFRALTGLSGASAEWVSVPVPDERIDRLAALYRPRKTTYATVEFADLGGAAGLGRSGGELGTKFLSVARQSQALVQVVDAFSLPEAAAETIAEAVSVVDTELAMADCDQVQRRIEKLSKEGARSGPLARELELLRQAEAHLAAGRSLRLYPELAGAPELHSFAFLTAKPIITVINTPEERPGFDPAELPDEVQASRGRDRARTEPLCAALEAEIASLPAEEAQAFLAGYGIERAAGVRVIRDCYELLGLIAFFTVGEDEVRAWTVHADTRAQVAGGVIHGDIERGFIRAEVIDWQQVLELGGFEPARRAGKLRLEGKDYLVRDGDVISYRFAV